MAEEVLTTPYDSAQLLFGKPTVTWLNSYDALRVAAYMVYDDVYWNEGRAFELRMRGSNEFPIYVPSARIIVNTLARYVMRGFGWAVDPKLGSDTERTEILAEYEKLFRREKLKSKFNSAKLYGIIRGDGGFYISADPAKPEGRRISIKEANPMSVFWLTDEMDDEVRTGVEIIEQIASAKDANRTYIKRQTWLLPNHPDHPDYDPVDTDWEAEITYEMRSLQLTDWDTDKAKAEPGATQIAQDYVEGITALPVYMWRNGHPEPGNPWGVSEIRGLETLIAGVNGAVSDQDVALAIAGLGQYVTDAGAPVNEDDEEVPWGLGPQSVVEVAAGRKFERIGGVSSVEPSLKHIEMLQDQAFRINGSGDVAQGRVDVQMAESGIALTLRMGPLLDEAADRDTEIEDCLIQMFHDLKAWFDSFEGLTFGEEVEILPTKGDKLPENKDKRVEQLMTGLAQDPPLFSQEYVWDELRRLGWEIPKDMEVTIAEELEFYKTTQDAYAGRLEDEAPADEIVVEDETVV